MAMNAHRKVMPVRTKSPPVRRITLLLQTTSDEVGVQCCVVDTRPPSPVTTCAAGGNHPDATAPPQGEAKPVNCDNGRMNSCGSLGMFQSQRTPMAPLRGAALDQRSHEERTGSGGWKCQPAESLRGDHANAVSAYPAVSCPVKTVGIYTVAAFRAQPELRRTGIPVVASSPSPRPRCVRRSEDAGRQAASAPPLSAVDRMLQVADAAGQSPGILTASAMARSGFEVKANLGAVAVHAGEGISPAPRSTTSRASATRVFARGRAPPCTKTSQPLPSARFAASIAATAHCAP